MCGGSLRCLTPSSSPSSSSPGGGGKGLAGLGKKKKKNGGYSVQDFADIAEKAEDVHDELLTNLAEIDIVIGQYLRGNAGAVIATQVQILENLKEADDNFSRLMRAVPVASKVPLN